MPLSKQEPTDDDLVRRTRAGDEGAAKELFDRHLADLRARARTLLPALLRGKVAESDVIQEVYLAAFRRLGDFEDHGKGSFGRWLNAILENKVHREIRRYLGTDKRAARREATRTFSSSSGGSADPRDPGPTASAVAVHRESQVELRGVVETLSEDHQAVIRMLNVQRLPAKEVAEVMGRSEAAVYKLYARALAEFGKRVASARVRDKVRPRPEGTPY